MLKAAAVYDYAGAFSVGMSEAGLIIDIKCEDETGYGMEAYAGNMAHTGWPDLVADSPRDWPARDVNVVFANPPCSAFSQYLGDSKYAAMGSAGVHGRQNQCMFDVIDYAAKCHPEIVLIESVQAAGRAGRPLMRTLRNRLEALTRRRYTITYVFMNVLSIGGYQNRPRFFCVMSRNGPISVPLADGWARPVSEVIGDLVDVQLERSMSPRAKRLSTLAKYQVDGEDVWRQGASSAEVYAKALEHGYPEWAATADGRTLGRSDQIRSPFTAWRWRWDQVAQVVTGGFLEDRVHPVRPRTFTYREAARLMGFPDTWSVKPVIAAGAKGKAFFGKGVTVQAGNWIGRAVSAHLEGIELPVRPIKETDDEWIIDVTSAFKGNKAPLEQSVLFDGYVDDSIVLTKTGRVSTAKTRQDRGQRSRRPDPVS